MKKFALSIVPFARSFGRDLLKLKAPVTAAAVTALVVQLVSPFGLDVGPWGPRITGVLVAVGVVSNYVDHLRANG